MSRPLLLPSTDALPDGELVARALSGDRWGREVLYRRHVSYLLGMVVRMLGRRDDAEEIVQDTFVVAFSQLETLRDPGALRGWLAQIAASFVRRRIRKLKLLRLVGLDRGGDDATLSELAAPSMTPEARGELALVDRALTKMSTACRLAWILRHVEGLELTEVASVAGCSLATAKRRIAAAETQIAAHVANAEGEGP